MFYYFPRNSSVKEGTNNIVKQEKTKLGKFEMQLLAYAQLRKKEFISSGEIASALDINAEQEWKLLNRMTTSGLIIRLKRASIWSLPECLPADVGRSAAITSFPSSWRSSKVDTRSAVQRL